MSTEIAWFVEPEDAHTNGIIAKRLLELSQLEENVSLFDNEGNEHSVFRVEKYDFITHLYKDKNNSQLRFKVFSQKGVPGEGFTYFSHKWIADAPQTK